MEAQSVPPAPPAPRLHTMPLAEVPEYPPFLSEISQDDGILLANPLDDLRALPSLERYTPEHRAALVTALAGDLERWGAPAAARAAAALLGESGTYAVVTGQQAGVAGGPLYTLYKAVGAVRAAEELERLHPGSRFVPVFWIEADDHDFDEVRTVTVLDRAGAVAAIAYDDGDARALHVGDRATDADALAALLEGLRAALPATEFGEQAVGLVESAYAAGGTLADGFARIVYAILGDTPLVVLSSRNAGLKRLAADVFARETEDPAVLYEALAAATATLAAAGLPTPITPRQGALFITDDGERRWLEPLDEHAAGGYRIRGTERTLTRAETTALAADTPEIFSPKVGLRPIVQDAILPTAIYLGGPSEVAYLRQLRAGYAPFGIAAPAVGPRPFVLMIEPKVRRAIDGAAVPLETLLAEEFDAAARFVDHEAERAVDASLAAAQARVTEAGAALATITSEVDPTLVKALGAATAAAAKAYDDLARRLTTALRKKQQTDIDRLTAARTAVMPGGGLQERTLNALSLVARIGLDRFTAALAAIRMEPGVLQVVDV